MAAQNLGGVSGILFTDRRDFHISPQVTRELWTDVAPFTTIVSARGLKQIGESDYKMFEHTDAWEKQQVLVNNGGGYTFNTGSSDGTPGDTISGGVAFDGAVGLPTTGDSSFIGLFFEVWDTTMTTYKGVVRVHNLNSAALILKSWGNPRAVNNKCAALVDNDILYCIGNGFGEGNVAPEANGDDLKVVWNSTGIFRTSIEITGSLYRNTRLRGYSDELGRLRTVKNREHKVQKERMFLFGVRHGGTNSNYGDTWETAPLTDKDGNNVRTSMGVISTLYKYGTSTDTSDAQNVFIRAGATYKSSLFIDDMEKVFQYVPDTGYKTAICGRGFLSYWSKMSEVSGYAKNSGWGVRLSDMKRDTLGFNYSILETPHGVLKLVWAPVLRHHYRNHAVILDEESLTHVASAGMMLKANIKTDNGYDGVKDEYFSEEGIMMQLLKRHSLMVIN